MHVEDLGLLAVAADDALVVGEEEALLAAQAEVGAVDNLVDEAGGDVRGGGGGDDGAVGLDHDVLAVAGLDVDLGPVPGDGEPLGGAADRVAAQAAAVGRGHHKLVLDGAEGPLLGGRVNLQLEGLQVRRLRLVGADVVRLRDGDKLAQRHRLELELRLRVRQAEELVLGRRLRPVGPDRAVLAERRQVLAVARAEGHLAAVELEEELAVRVGLWLEGAVGGEEAAVGGLDLVALLLEDEVEGEDGVAAPGDVLVRGEGVALEVDKAAAAVVADADLRVHGQLHRPEPVLGGGLGIRIHVAHATEVAAVLGLEGPAAVGEDLDRQPAVGRGVCLGALDLAVIGAGDDLALVAAQHDLGAAKGLEREDRVDLQRLAVGGDLATKLLLREVLVVLVDQTDAPHARHGWWW
eukprot:m.54531 g.54531  ORF g.54531 m.54531 type:complete len:408 (+) comp13259_c0_seq1:632-1855(+)